VAASHGAHGTAGPLTGREEISKCIGKCGYIGVHQEERRVTFSDRRPPTIPALLARRVLGAYVRLLDEDRAEQGEPGKESDGKYAARPPEC
jgi:hypothetical protein